MRASFALCSVRKIALVAIASRDPQRTHSSSRRVDPRVVCRVHRSAIVKLARIRGLESSESGEYDVVLHDATRIAVSRRYRKALKARLDARAL
jgi:DNA-binding LytR/AlgR family response regulator